MPFETPDLDAAQNRKLLREREKEAQRRNSSPLRNEPMRELFDSEGEPRSTTLADLLKNIPEMLAIMEEECTGIPRPPRRLLPESERSTYVAKPFVPSLAPYPEPQGAPAPRLPTNPPLESAACAQNNSKPSTPASSTPLPHLRASAASADIPSSSPSSPHSPSSSTPLPHLRASATSADIPSPSSSSSHSPSSSTPLPHLRASATSADIPSSSPSSPHSPSSSTPLPHLRASATSADVPSSSSSTPRSPASSSLSHHPFIWPNVFPSGQLSLLAGPPGIGKSFLMHDLAARLSRGGPMPFSTRADTARRKVIFFGGEDSLLYTIAPRLKRMNADPENIEFIYALLKPCARFESPVQLERDMLSFRQDIAGARPALVVIETLPAVLRNRPDVIRAAFAWLDRTAWEFNCAIVALTHTNPIQADRNYHHLIGNCAYTTASRLIWRMEHTGEKGLRHLTLEKCNIPMPDTLITFSIEDSGINYLNSKHLAPIFDIHRPKYPDPCIEEAKDFLLFELKDGPRPKCDVLLESRKQGIAKRTLQRAVRELKITTIEPIRPSAAPKKPVKRKSTKKAVKAGKTSKAPKLPRGTTTWLWILPTVQITIPITMTEAPKTPNLGGETFFGPLSAA